MLQKRKNINKQMNQYSNETKIWKTEENMDMSDEIYISLISVCRVIWGPERRAGEKSQDLL